MSIDSCLLAIADVLSAGFARTVAAGLLVLAKSPPPPPPSSPPPPSPSMPWRGGSNQINSVVV
jgi:hypothetical protein